MKIFKKIKQAWLTAELIINGHWRAEDVQVTWYDPAYRAIDKAYRTVKYPLPKDHPLRHVGYDWPDSTPSNKLPVYEAKCPKCGFWMIPRYDTKGNQIERS